MREESWLPLLIFAGTYVVLGLGRIPGWRVDRTGACIIGAGLMVASGTLTVDEAWAAINADTIILLFGMMIVVANLRLAGFFRLAGAWAVRRAHRPAAMLATVAGVSAVLSAFFVNDTICIVMTPLVLEIAAALSWNPVPYLLAVAIASNIGSAATITGNPQNMMIGSFSGIQYRDFAASLAPVAAFGIVIAWAILYGIYRGSFRSKPAGDVPRRRVRVHKPLLWKSLTAASFLLFGFFAGWPIAKVALTAGAFVLVTRRIKPQKIYQEIDFGLLVLFCGLFVVVAGVEKAVVTPDLIALVERLRLGEPATLTALSALLSNLVSNVPAVLIFQPFVEHLADPKRAWLVLAMSSTLAGNLTVVGSVANLIVVQRARPTVHISFREYFRAGAPITLATLLVGVWWLSG